MYVKIHRSYRHVVAISDRVLLGKKFEEGNRQLEIRESFFKGTEHDSEEVVNIIKQEMKEDSTFNIVGQKSIDAAKKAGLITDESVLTIQDIPFSLVLV